LVLIVVAALLLSGVAEEHLRYYRRTTAWNQAHLNEFWYYHVFFVERYPTFWSLTPLAILLAVIHRPRPAIFCTCIFVVSFVLVSFGGMKDYRYLFFAMPFLFTLWAIALAKVFEFLYPWLLSAVNRVLRRLTPYVPNRPARACLIAVGVVFLIACNGGVVKGLMLLTGTHLVSGEEGLHMVDNLRRTDWEIAKPFLTREAHQASVVLTSRDMHFLYYVGVPDFVVSVNRISELDDEEFSIDARTGLPIVSTAESINRILECYPDGLLVIEAGHWRSSTAVSDEVADAIEAASQAIAMPPESQIKAFRWQRLNDTRPEHCNSLPPPRAADSAAAEIPVELDDAGGQ
jgi:hypothetical protein